MEYRPTWHLSGTPYAVQLEALRRSRNKYNYAYFHEMGLGKSPLVLNDWLENFPDFDTAIVLCPNSFKLEWTMIPKQWGVPQIIGYYWPTILKPSKRDKYRLYAINYEAIRSHNAYGKVAALMESRPCVLIVDESSAIKNHMSLTARAVLDLARRAGAVRLLNGTPMANNVMDLYSQLKCVNELDRVNPYVFRNRFAVMGGWMGKKCIGVKNEEELHVILDRCSHRALKKDWLDLPEKIYSPTHLPMTAKQQLLYKQMLRDFIVLVNKEEFSAQMVIDQLGKLRQIAGGIILDGDKWELIEPPEKNPKLQATLDIIRAAPGKVIVVHFYVKTGELIMGALRKQQLWPAFIRGGMKPHEVEMEKTKFNYKPDCRVMVVQITAGSKSHTLIGGEGDNRCSTMIFYDQTFSLIDRAQVEDRIHRGGQDRVCVYHDLICSPVDEAQLKALKSKQDIASAVIDVVKAMASPRPTDAVEPSTIRG